MTSVAPASDFVPADLDATKWENLQPLYEQLLNRELHCENCLQRLLLDRSELDATVSEAMANLYIAMTCHTEDESAQQAYLDFVEHVEPKLKPVAFQLDRRIVESPHAAKLDPARYEVLLRDLQVNVELFREENVPLQTEESKLGQQYDQICGAMTVEFRGEEKTMPQMALYLEENDRPTREEAWRAMADRRLADRERIEDIFDSLIKLRHEIARNAGFENYRDYAFRAMHRFDYTPADCQAFHQAIEKVCVPVHHELNRQRAETLGVDTLRPWDLAVDPKGRDPLRPFENSEELVEGTSKLFHRMDEELGGLFDRLRGGDCLDLETRKGKAPGGYQYQRDRSRKPFIFMNAAGLHRDLETMVHEAGHAFHSMFSEHEPLLHYREAPIEFAEVASMSMELIAFPYLDAFYKEDDTARAKRTQLEQLSMILPWIATIDAFQHWIYTNPGHSRDEREQYWVDLMSRFGADVSWDGLEPYRAALWQKQGHLFDVPFYYIEYGIAQLGALQLWRQARRDERAALQNYKKAMTLGGSRPLPELFETAELRFDFSTDMMSTLMDEVRSELAALPQ